MLLSRLVLIELQRGLEVRQLHLTQDAARGHGAPVEEVAPTWNTNRVISCSPPHPNPHPPFGPGVCGLTGHSDADVSGRPGSGLGVRRAELVQVHGRLVAVGRLSEAQTLNIQHNAVHTGDAGLGTGGHGLHCQPRTSSHGGPTVMPRAFRMLSLQMGQVQCSFSHGSTHTL